MVSQQFIALINDMRTYMHTDYETIDQCLYRLQSEWKELQGLWQIGTVEEIKLLLFNMSRRGFEICALLTKEDVFYYLDTAIELHKTKNAGYSGNSEDAWKNFREVEKFGISAADGCLTRFADKYSRFWTVRDNPKNDQVNESLLDTMLDWSNYAIILYCLLDEERN